jgi:hypothetical protein
LVAPAISAIGLSSSTSSMVVTLCGIVTSAPRMFVSVKTDRKKAG